jgi:hypothetical protein
MKCRAFASETSSCKWLHAYRHENVCIKKNSTYRLISGPIVVFFDNRKYELNWPGLTRASSRPRKCCKYFTGLKDFFGIQSLEVRISSLNITSQHWAESIPYRRYEFSRARLPVAFTWLARDCKHNFMKFFPSRDSVNYEIKNKINSKSRSYHTNVSNTVWKFSPVVNPTKYGIQ